MEIFKLFGSVFVDNEKANKSISKTDEKGQGLASTFEGVGKTIKTGMIVAGTALAGLAIAGTKAADELKGSLNDLQAATGSTDEEMKAMEKSLKNIYKGNYGEGFDDIAQSMASVKQTTGQVGEELEKTTQTALMMRDTFEFEVSDSINTVNSMMEHFEITADQAYTIIAQGAQSGANKNGDLLDIMNEYAPHFDALGFSAEKSMDILIKGAQDGAFQVDKIGDAMKEFTIRSKDMSKGSADAFKSLGLDSDIMFKSFAEGGEASQEAFQQVMEGLNNIEDPLEKNAVGVALFGTMFEDLEAGAIESLANVTSVADSTADTLQQIDGVKYETLGEAFQGIKRNLETAILIPLGQKVLPKLNEFADWLIENGPVMEEKATKFFDGLGNAIKFVSDNLDILVPLLVWAASSIAAMKVIGLINGLMAMWTAATATQTTAQTSLNVAMSANPIGILILAIGALVAAGVALYMHWDEIKEKVTELWEALKEKFEKIKESITGKVNEIKDNLTKKWDEIKAMVPQKVKEMKEAAIKKFESLWDDIKKVGDKIKKSIKDAFDIKLPHFSIKIGTKTIMGKEIKYPKGFDVEWYDKGGIFNQPSIIGVGEKRPEFVGALDDLRYLIRDELINSKGNVEQVINIAINNPVVRNEFEEEELIQKILDTVSEFLATAQTNTNRAVGVV